MLVSCFNRVCFMLKFSTPVFRRLSTTIVTPYNTSSHSTISLTYLESMSSISLSPIFLPVPIPNPYPNFTLKAISLPPLPPISKLLPTNTSLTLNNYLLYHSRTISVQTCLTRSVNNKSVAELIWEAFFTGIWDNVDSNYLPNFPRISLNAASLTTIKSLSTNTSHSPSLYSSQSHFRYNPT